MHSRERSESLGPPELARGFAGRGLLHVVKNGLCYPVKPKPTAVRNLKKCRYKKRQPLYCIKPTLNAPPIFTAANQGIDLTRAPVTEGNI